MSLRRVVVGRVGRPHGVHGLVSVDVRTDEPERRFVAGTDLIAEGHGPRTVVSARWHSGRLLLQLDGVEDRSAAEALRGADLAVDVDADERPGDDEEWYDHQLVGLRAVDGQGRDYGPVTEVVHLPMQDLLAVQTAAGEVLVPFVRALVPAVDLESGRVVLEPPPGLFDGG